MKAFVTGAGTEIGKTYVTAALAEGLRAAGRSVRALKPVVSGVGEIDEPEFQASDTAILLRAQGRPLARPEIEACSPWRFRAPLAPDMAASAEGRSLGLGEIVDWCRARLHEQAPGQALLFEGAGGVMSPIAEDGTNLDLIAALGLPAILVGGTYLGAISHALTAIEALRARRMRVLAVILNETGESTVGLEPTADAIRRFAPGVRIERVARGGARVLASRAEALLA